MSSTHLEVPYQCWDDCLMQGCPGHMATLDYQSTSNAWHFKDHRQDLFSTGGEIGALFTLVGLLAGSRVEAESVIRAATQALSSAKAPGDIQSELNKAVVTELERLAVREWMIDDYEYVVAARLIHNRIAELTNGEQEK